jgi:hypothetical protein
VKQQMQKIKYKKHVKKIEDDIKNNPKKFWNFVSNAKKNSGIPIDVFFNEKIAKTVKDACNLFSDFFSSVFNKKCNVNINLHTNENNVNENIPRVSKYDITCFINELKNGKSTGSDNIPISVLKEINNEISVPLEILFNKIMTSGVYPERWKIANVTPIHKSGKKTNVSNYRPISLLPIFSKLMEKFMYKTLYQVAQFIIPVEQHGFTPRRSTATNLVHFHSFLASSFNDTIQVDTVYTDFQKAFDKVPHHLLIKKLHELKIPHFLLKLVENYLYNRKQVVVINGEKSDPADVTSGVPQGSLLGPLLFNLYLADLPQKFNFVKCLMYADDLKLFQRIAVMSDCIKFQDDLEILFSWCNEWGMILSIPKCYSITFANKNKVLHLFDYSINNSVLKKVNEIKDLGVIFDSKLTFNAHIHKVKSKSFKMFGFINRNSQLFRAKTYKLLYQSFILSNHDYASPVWSSCHSSKDHNLEAIQRKFVRKYHEKAQLDYNSDNYELVCKNMNLLTLQNRRKRNDIIFLKKVLCNKPDATLNSMIMSQIKINCPQRTLRNPSFFYIPTYNNDVSRYSFIPRATSLCNEMHLDIYKDTYNNIKKTVQCFVKK